MCLVLWPTPHFVVIIELTQIEKLMLQKLFSTQLFISHYQQNSSNKTILIYRRSFTEIEIYN